jgi:hypothetical protein
MESSRAQQFCESMQLFFEDVIMDEGGGGNKANERVPFAMRPELRRLLKKSGA